MPTIIGTAGHIDHGKSAIVKALTGTDPDRLREEKERGMTIDLGFAFLNEDIAFIDVPGHERFIKNMVAGASVVDMAMLVIAADDGIMPQTREHLDILQLLRLQRGLVVINKIDLVDAELLQLVRQEVKAFLKDSFLATAPVFEVSAATGQGIENLRQGILELAAKPFRRSDHGIFWLPVDRSFSMKGFGTIITGSILSGEVRVGDTVEILPAGMLVKVRGLQSHGKAVQRLGIGQRAAINLQNIKREQVSRGDVLATPHRFRPTRWFDVQLTLLPEFQGELSNHNRVRVHVGTREVMARVRLLDVDKLLPGRTALAQLQLEATAVARRRDPFIIRRYSPPLTIGGGIILDAEAQPHRRFDAAIIAQLQGLLATSAEETLLMVLQSKSNDFLSVGDLLKATDLNEAHVLALLNRMEQAGVVRTFSFAGKPTYILTQTVTANKQRLLGLIDQFHQREPLKAFMSKAELRTNAGEMLGAKLFDVLLQELAQEGEIVLMPQGIKRAGHTVVLSPAAEQLAQKIIRILHDHNFTPPNDVQLAQKSGHSLQEVRSTLSALIARGDIVRLEGDIYFTKQAIEKAQQLLRAHADSKDEISVGEFREKLQTTRKYAVPLLSYFDQIGLTERYGDGRKIIKERLKPQEE